MLFPGQGAQAVGMGKDVAAASAAARAVFERANAVLGFDLTTLCFEGPADQLERTDIQQPAIFVTSAALWEALQERGASIDRFAAAGGLSLGEYTALWAAGALSFEDALKLVHERGRLMQAAALATPSGMVSLIGADEAAAKALCERRRPDEVLVTANFNCPGQIVLSGSKAACERAVVMAEEVGCRAVALPVAGAFHSPIMGPAADGLSQVLMRTNLAVPRIPVVANVNAGYHAGAEGIRESLTRQLTQPVLWQRCVERMIEDGVQQFVEVGPGRVLTGLLRKINRSVKGVAVGTMEAVASFAGSAE